MAPHPAPLPKLLPAKARMAIRGPWLALAAFAAGAVPRGEPWRLGSASSDSFAFSMPEPAAELGRSMLSAEAHCPMGPPIGALRDVSAMHPALAFLLQCDGEGAQLEVHRISAGGSESRFGCDASAWLESLAELPEAWAQADMECGAWAAAGGPAPPSASICLGKLRTESPADLLLMVRLLSGGPCRLPSPWPEWSASMPDVWTCAASPWTPPPPWRPSAEGFSMRGLGELAASAADSRTRLAAARRQLDLAARWARLDRQSAIRDLSASIALSTPPSPGNASWAAAAAAASAPAQIAFMDAAGHLGASVASLAGLAEFLAIAQAKPEFARALLLALPWGYGASDVQLIAKQAPEMVASLALAQDIASELGDSAGGGSKGKSRL